jgi:hypothetical protein
MECPDYHIASAKVCLNIRYEQPSDGETRPELPMIDGVIMMSAGERNMAISYSRHISSSKVTAGYLTVRLGGKDSKAWIDRLSHRFGQYGYRDLVRKQPKWPTGMYIAGPQGILLYKINLNDSSICIYNRNLENSSATIR